MSRLFFNYGMNSGALIDEGKVKRSSSVFEEVMNVYIYGEVLGKDEKPRSTLSPARNLISCLNFSVIDRNKKPIIDHHYDAFDLTSRYLPNFNDKKVVVIEFFKIDASLAERKLVHKNIYGVVKYIMSEHYNDDNPLVFWKIPEEQFSSVDFSSFDCCSFLINNEKGHFLMMYK